MADAAARLSRGAARDDDLGRLRGWTTTVAGRGACRHPDGAANLLRTGLEVFEHDFDAHQRRRTCLGGPIGRAA
jgi:NADH:ubiquinone oxidoreductase subunit F (NADH-binding)